MERLGQRYLVAGRVEFRCVDRGESGAASALEPRLVSRSFSRLSARAQSLDSNYLVRQHYDRIL